MYLSIDLSIAPSIYLAMYLAMYLLIYLSMCLCTLPREGRNSARGWRSRRGAGARGALAGLGATASACGQSVFLFSGTHRRRRCFPNRSFSVACSLAKPGPQGVTEKGKQNGGRTNAKAGSRLRAPMAWQSLGKRMRAISLLVSGTHSGRRCFPKRSLTVTFDFTLNLTLDSKFDLTLDFTLDMYISQTVLVLRGSYLFCHSQANVNKRIRQQKQRNTSEIAYVVSHGWEGGLSNLKANNKRKWQCPIGKAT